MADITYNWKRYWVLRDGRFHLDSDGFLLPPTANAGDFTWWKTDAIGFDELLPKRCLVLLGEPGIGKTFATRDAEQQSRATRPGATFLRRDLGNYNSDSLLIEDVFHSSEFTGWQKNGGELHLFLDSLDECLLRVDTVAGLLADQFSRLPSIENLYLRIACRTVEWPTALEDALLQKWGIESVGVYELVTLTRDQVLESAKIQVNEPQRFMEEIVASEVGAFATKPLTLDLLLKVWRKRGGSLPATQREIYEQGCLELCVESERRQTPQLRRRLSPEQRLAVASHIAAAMFFCNRAAIWIGRPSAKPASDVSISELVHGSVTAGTKSMTITENSIREALDTGLFTSRGRDRLGWAHQTYGEFLAAHYLSRENLNDRQSLDLLTHPNEPGQRLIPQLHEVAAWAASVNTDLFARLTRNEPEVLLRSDVATADPKIKHSLVDALLRAAGMETVHVNRWAMRKRYRKLCHPQLIRQLRSHIFNRTLTPATRYEAISMAEACELNELLPDLSRLALTAEENSEIRKFAATVVSRCGDTKLKKRLRPLALGKLGTDPDRELRAAGLKACWPDYISAQEVFSSLMGPTGTADLYDQFVSHDLIQLLPAKDLPVALTWVEAQPENGYSLESDGLIHRVLNKAAEHIETPGIIVPFARAVIARLRAHDLNQHREDSSLIKLLESRNDQRLALVEAIIPFFRDPRGDSSLLTNWGLKLIVRQDFTWLAERVAAEERPHFQAAYAYLLSWIFQPDDAARISRLIEVSQTRSVLIEAMPYWLQPTSLESDAALKAREYYYDEQRRREEVARRREPKVISPTPAEQLNSLLDQFEAGDLDAWWKICAWLEVEDNGRYCRNNHSMDIRELIGWKNASDPTKTRLLSAAQRYVCNRGPKAEEWFSRKNIVHRPAVAGFRALLLLANEASTEFASLPDEVWERWAPAVLGLHVFNEQDAHRLLAAKLFERKPGTATDWTVRVLNQENKDGNNLWVLFKLPNKWSLELGEALLRRAKRGKLKPQCIDQLLTTLLAQNIVGTLDIIRDLVPKRPPARPPRRLTAVFAARLSMLHGNQSDWPRVFKLIKANSAFGRAVLEGFAYDYQHAPAPVLKTLREPDVGALWEWMLKQYPAAEDRDRSGGGEVTTRDAMGDLRDRLVSHLADVGTEAGCSELQRLIGKYPQFTWFRRVLARGQEQMRRNTWMPPQPAVLFSLAENCRARLVQSSAQLQEVVISSLEFLQERLHGERQMAQFLWDRDQPKPEEAISEWVAAHLEDDLKRRGVVLGREVQIHRFDKTDIHVTAITQDQRTEAFDAVRMIIEVKGCWHREVKTAMQTQLVERYLADNDCHQGVYLVGWFPQEGWNKSDSRRKSVAFRTRKDLETYVAEQARTLSATGNDVHAVILDFSLRTPAQRKLRTPGRKKRPRK